MGRPKGEISRPEDSAGRSPSRLLPRHGSAMRLHSPRYGKGTVVLEKGKPVELLCDHVYDSKKDADNAALWYHGRGKAATVVPTDSGYAVFYTKLSISAMYKELKDVKITIW